MGRSKEWDSWSGSGTAHSGYVADLNFNTDNHTTSNIVVDDAEVVKPSHYDNSNGSLYKFCEEKNLNSYEFDIIKRVMRCRSKGSFIEDLNKTKFLIDLYLKEWNGKV